MPNVQPQKRVLTTTPTLPHPLPRPLFLHRPLFYPPISSLPLFLHPITAATATQGGVGPPVGISGKARLGGGDLGQVRRSSSEVGSRRRGQLGETGVGQRRQVKLTASVCTNVVQWRMSHSENVVPTHAFLRSAGVALATPSSWVCAQQRKHRRPQQPLFTSPPPQLFLLRSPRPPPRAGENWTTSSSCSKRRAHHR